MFTQKQFSLTDEEYAQIEKWAKTHECPCRRGKRPSKSCCGGEISVTFTPTSFGTVVSAEFTCGAKLELDNL